MGVSVLTVNKCCFFLSLETGAKIIGFVYVVLSFLIWTTQVYSSLTWYDPEYFIEEEISLVNVSLSLCLVFGLYLVFGTYEKKRTFIMAWLIFNWTLFAAVLYGTLISRMYGRDFSTTFDFLIPAGATNLTKLPMQPTKDVYSSLTHLKLQISDIGCGDRKYLAKVDFLLNQ